MRRSAAAAALTAFALSASACTDTGSSQQPTDDVVVLAAASLNGAFTRLGNSVEDEHPGINIRFSFGGSSSLAPQVTSGAPADVFASANPDVMQLLIDGGSVTTEPQLFARNRLEIGVPEGNPAGVQELEDLTDSETTVALCAPQVPCGAAAQKALRAAGISVEPVSYEDDVKAVASKVELGEVDAGLIYHTDVLAATGRIEGIEFEEADRAVNDYVIAPVADGANPEGAEVFIDFVRSLRGREVLRDAGFDVP